MTTRNDRSLRKPNINQNKPKLATKAVVPDSVKDFEQNGFPVLLDGLARNVGGIRKTVPRSISAKSIFLYYLFGPGNVTDPIFYK